MKKFAIAAALIAATAMPAMAATDGFSNQRSVTSAAHVDLDIVRSSTDGRVEIRDGSSLATGALLGSEDVRAGLESDVRIDLEHKPFRSHVFAVLYDADGEVTATKLLRVVE
ncbi:hypothetical protein [uncultured Limimaricola sp.]|uniref:hypothetical protein n=1 Tax=uncultured Limimaricola sp. TaxID=2211667 RepID=UPI0030F8FEC1